MPKKTAVLAKLSRPRLFGVYARERLFALLTERRRSPVVWIVGPPGAGKTTLAASYLDAQGPAALWYQLDGGDADPASFFYYLRQCAAALAGRQGAALPLLTPEYGADLPGFARQWWRELFARLPAGLVLVLDNYQEVPAASALHRMLAAAAEEIPAGANLIVLSRSDPPAAFARLLAGERLVTLEWSDLRLTLEEARGLSGGQAPLAEEALRELYGRCDGWAAGFTLMRERLRRTGEINRLGEALPRETVFDYFATQIFSEATPQTRETLIRTAFMPRFTLAMAEQLSADPEAGTVLAQLHQQHLFIDCRAGTPLTYEFHALFRAFLLAQAYARYSPLELARIRGEAAGLLQQQSQLEAALELYLAAGAHDQAIRLILRQAPSLVAAGRARTLQGWIERLPPAAVEPIAWLRYWSGVCLLPIDPVRARGLFEHVYQRFEACGDTLGEIQSAVGVIDGYYLERAGFAPLDPWIALIFTRIACNPAFVSPADELAVVASTLIATLYRQPAHPGLPLLAERTHALLTAEVGVNRKAAAAAFLLNYYDWAGESGRADELVALLRPLLSHRALTPLWRATWELRLCIHHLVLGDLASSRASLRLAATLAHDNGFAAIELTARLFETMLCLSKSDLAGAEAALVRVDQRLEAGRRMDYSLALRFKGWVALAKGDLSAAVQLGERSAAAGEAAGVPNVHSHALIYLAHFYSERGDFGPAHTALAKAGAATVLERYPLLQFDAELVGADLLWREGDGAGGEAALRRALALGARCGYYGGLCWLPRMLERLCAGALARGIEVEYVARLIAHRELQRPAPEVLNWPCRLRVFTLGRFALERDGAPIRFVGKLPKKPLELLKALIALGGPEVAGQTLRTALWPEAETQAADNALGITLIRLRKLLGEERAVTQQGGKLSLDPRLCWVDAWALQALLDRARTLLHARAGLAELEEVAARICDLNRGAFLADDPELPWIVPLRDRLRARVIRVLVCVGQELEQAGQTQAAIELYAQALEQDNLAEELYRRLMICHAQLGQRAEAMAVYRRCRELLSIVLGLQPGEATEQVFRALQCTLDRPGRPSPARTAQQHPAPVSLDPRPPRLPHCAGQRRDLP